MAIQMGKEIGPLTNKPKATTTKIKSKQNIPGGLKI